MTLSIIVDEDGYISCTNGTASTIMTSSVNSSSGSITTWAGLDWGSSVHLSDQLTEADCKKFIQFLKLMNDDRELVKNLTSEDEEERKIAKLILEYKEEEEEEEKEEET